MSGSAQARTGPVSGNYFTGQSALGNRRNGGPRIAGGPTSGPLPLLRGDAMHMQPPQSWPAPPVATATSSAGVGGVQWTRPPDRSEGARPGLQRDTSSRFLPRVSFAEGDGGIAIPAPAEAVSTSSTAAAAAAAIAASATVAPRSAPELGTAPRHPRLQHTQSAPRDSLSLHRSGGSSGSGAGAGAASIATASMDATDQARRLLQLEAQLADMELVRTRLSAMLNREREQSTALHKQLAQLHTGPKQAALDHVLDLVRASDFAAVAAPLVSTAVARLHAWCAGDAMALPPSSPNPAAGGGAGGGAGAGATAGDSITAPRTLGLQDLVVSKRIGARSTPRPHQRFYGANSAVYEATVKGTGAPVAVKVMFAMSAEGASVDTPTLTERYQSEWQVDVCVYELLVRPVGGYSVVCF